GASGRFAGLEIDPGGTPFQQAVWTALRRVPPGETTTYAALARAIGAPTAVRAVGAANGANPIWLIIPCHRAIGSDGRLVGYAGGLERKRWLLAHESAAAPQASLAFDAASATWFATFLHTGRPRAPFFATGTVRFFRTERADEALPVVAAYVRRIEELAAAGAQVVVLPEKFVGVTPAYADAV